MVAIFILTVFLFLISGDLIVLKFQGKSHPVFEPSFPRHDSLVYNRNTLAIPSNIILSKGHTWLRKNHERMIDIGIDAFGTTVLSSSSILKCAEEGRLTKRKNQIAKEKHSNGNPNR